METGRPGRDQDQCGRGALCMRGGHAADQTVRQADIENLASRFPVIRASDNVRAERSGAETSPHQCYVAPMSMPLLLTSRAAANWRLHCIALPRWEVPLPWAMARVGVAWP